MAKRMNFDRVCTTPPKKQRVGSVLSQKAEVEAVVRSVSPGKNFFDGELSDGDALIRFYGFDIEQAKKLKAMCDAHQACVLRNCVIKRGRNVNLKFW